MINAGVWTIGHIALIAKSGRWFETQIVIGEKKFWNKGYGTKAMKLLLEKAKQLGIKKIFLDVNPGNERAIRMYEACGFKKKGVHGDGKIIRMEMV